MSKKKICAVTGSRSEYGIQKWILKGIMQSDALALQLVVTGMHLSPEFGLTYREIEKDGFTIDKKVEMLLSSDSEVGISKSTALGLAGFADVFADLNPDIVLILGDRYEVLSAAIAAMFARIPIAHVHGGETSEGAFDEAIRHSITKMSYLHFVATETYRKRVIQLGESPDRVFNVGGSGIDALYNIQLLTKAELETELGIKLGKRNLLITFHPVTLEYATSRRQMQELLMALEDTRDTVLIFTKPNSDTDGRIISMLIDEFCVNNPNAKAFTSLGSLKYLSCLKYMDGVVGNSSSGLTEAPSFKVGTINIGGRQNGRVKAQSVIDCEPEKEAIRKALAQLFSDEFREKCSNVVNPYGTGGASNRIVEILASFPAITHLNKSFFDLE